MISPAEKFTQKLIGAVEDEWQLYSDDENDYTIGAPIGFGASSFVYSAVFQPPGAVTPVPCALKVLDLDRLPPNALRLLQRETQLMSISKHPNVLRVRGTWMSGHKLYIAMRLMNSGSASDVMRYGWPGGMEEEVIKAILKQALEGLNYFHINGLIHRDVKAANLLIDDDGTVLLGDLGVAAFLWDSEDSAVPSAIPDHRRVVSFGPAVTCSSPTHSQSRPRFGKRKSFVGTPCWMAPEVIEGKKYDSKADIWSFGITALELTQGRPPRSREPPQKVLLKTVQDAPPTLDRSGGPFKYSRAFQETVGLCLVKDPSKRPTASQLLQMPFFRGVKRKTYLVNTVLKDLPPLSQRQERRRQAPSVMQNTIESWEFSLPPNVSTFHRASVRLSQGSLDADTDLREELEINEAVFEPDEEQTQERLPDHATEDISISPSASEPESPSNVTSSRPQTPPHNTPPVTYLADKGLNFKLWRKFSFSRSKEDKSADTKKGTPDKADNGTKHSSTVLSNKHGKP